MRTPAIIEIEHVYSQPPSAVWKALTDPALHARWWAAGDVKPIVGHRFELDMGPWGKQRCEVLEVEHERVIKYRFATTSLNTIITWELTPNGSGTVLKLIHEGFDLDSLMGRTALEGMQGGWPGVLSRLDSLLASNP